MNNGEGPFDFIKDAVNAIGNLFARQHKDILTVMRQPTPVNIVSMQQAGPGGLIGGGFANPQPVILYQCPMSQEAWIHRITISVPGSSYTPGNPLQSGNGQVWVSGSTFGEPIFFLPVAGVVAPVQINEGRLSAPHLNPGESLLMVGDTLPANIMLRFDFQIVLVQGISDYTPRDMQLTELMP